VRGAIREAESVSSGEGALPRAARARRQKTGSIRNRQKSYDVPLTYIGIVGCADPPSGSRVMAAAARFEILAGKSSLEKLWSVRPSFINPALMAAVGVTNHS